MNKKTGIKVLTINEKKWCREYLWRDGQFCAAGFLAERMGFLPGVKSDGNVYNKLERAFGEKWRTAVIHANDTIKNNTKRKTVLRDLFAQKGIKLRFVNGKGGKK